MLIPQKRIMIFAHARSASTSLAKVFMSQGVPLLYEPFNPTLKNNSAYFCKNIGIRNACKKIYKCHAFGLKHLSDSVDSGDNLYLIRNHRTIYLYREDMLNSALSWTLAEQTKVYDLVLAKQKYQNTTYRLDPNIFLSLLFRLKKHMTYKSQEDMLVVSYEDLLCMGHDNKKNALHRIFEHAGVRLRNLQVAMQPLSPSRKINKREWSKIIENYGELHEIFENNRSIGPLRSLDVSRLAQAKMH